MAIGVAARRACALVSGQFFRFITPLAAASLLFRGLSWGLHRIGHGKQLLLEGVLLLVVYMPLSFFAEAVVSAMYLRALRGDKIGLVQIREVAGYPGSAGLVARLVGMCAFWLAVVVMVLAALLIAPILVMGIGIHLGHEARHGNQWFPILIMVTSVAVLSRYYFVMPMLAVRRSGGGDVFRAAVVKIKGYWGLLAVVGLVEYFASHFASQLAKRAGDWRGGRQTAVVAEILFSAVIATYVVAFITDLLVGQDADV